MTHNHNDEGTCAVHSDLMTVLTKMDANLKWIILIGGAMIVFLAWSVRTILPEVKEFNRTLAQIDKENGVQTSEINALKKMTERNSCDINDLKGQIKKTSPGSND